MNTENLKKNSLLALSILSLLLFTPLGSASAAINTLNGLSVLDQLLVTPGSSATNTLHMEIVTAGTDKHRFRWDGTPWRIDQGGTGISTVPLLGELLVGNGIGGYSLVDSTSFIGSVSVATSTNEVTDQLAVFSSTSGTPAQLAGYAGLTYSSSAETLFVNNIQPQPGNGLFMTAGGQSVTIQGDRILIGSTAGTRNVNLDTSLQTIDDPTIFFPDTQGVTDTFCLQDLGNCAGLANVFSAGPSATTTVNFGEIGDSTSRSCFNTKNTNGDDVSFYFVGTSMVIENNQCQ